MRIINSISEASILEHIYPLSPTQFMSFSGLEVIERIDQMAIRLDGSADYVGINIDFRKWNLRFRPEVIIQFAASLDYIFGCLHFYKKMHSSFTQSLS